MRGRAILLVLVLALLPRPTSAQVFVQDLLDVQVGNAPGVKPSNLVGTYDRVDLAFETEILRLGAQYQLDHNSSNLYPYARFTQRWLELAGSRGRLRVGNVYTILGRGLLQRSFQLPGVVLTDEGSPSRFGFSRDLDGVLAEGQAGPLSLRAISGAPTAGDISPGVADAFRLPLHSGNLDAGQLALGPWRGSSIGAVTLRLSPQSGPKSEFVSGFAAADPAALAGVDALSLPLYVEYALDQPTWREWWQFHAGRDRRHGLYASTGLTWDQLALSAEWKDYRHLLLGVNDPPSLVREQSYTLLNRITHVLNADEEHGIQFEGTWRQPGWGDLTLNRSHAEGRLVASQPPRQFEERFAEVHAAPGGWAWLDATLFADHSRDDFVGADRRETFGGVASAPLPAGWRSDLDLERQSGRQTGHSFVEHAASFTLHHPRWGSAGVAWQRSTNPTEARPGADLRTFHHRNWWGGTLSTRLAERVEATLFAGQRRKGLACTAGTCYAAEALEGAELRVLARF